MLFQSLRYLCDHAQCTLPMLLQSPTWPVSPIIVVVVHFVTPWVAACQVSLSPTISQSLVRFMATESVMTSNHLILCRPLLLCFQSFPASGSFPMSQLFASGGQSIGAWALVLPMSIELISFRIDRFELLAIQETQESSASQFKSMNSSALNLPSGTTLPSVHDYWKIHSFDHIDLCWQSDVSAF